MKTKAFLLSLIPVIFMLSCAPTHVVVESPAPAPAPAPPPPITYQTFYDALSPYGQWVDYPNVGYVWIPDTGPAFKPYATGGHWVYADAGWTWVSDYSWGWAPFHYGRWFFDDNYGWCWVPGYQWAPAWVTWRRGNDYYGWAPLAPEVGVSVTVAAYNPPPHEWCFVPRQYVASPQVTNYYVAENRNVTIVNNTTVINNTTVVNNNVRNVYVVGPERSEVEAVTHTTIQPVAFRESATPGAASEASGQLAVYRPTVRTAPATGQPTPAPARVVPLTSVRSVNRPAPQQAPPPTPHSQPPAPHPAPTTAVSTPPEVNTTAPAHPMNSNPVHAAPPTEGATIAGSGQRGAGSSPVVHTTATAASTHPGGQPNNKRVKKKKTPPPPPKPNN